MWFILGLKAFGLVVVAFSKHIVNWGFDLYEYIEDIVKKNSRAS